MQNLIKEGINNIMLERRKAQIKQIIKEELTRYFSNQNINEAESTDQKKNAVMSMLKNDLFSHATLAYQLFPDMDKDTARSYFSKLYRQEKEPDGTIRSFSDDQINKLYQLLRQKK